MDEQSVASRQIATQSLSVDAPLTHLSLAADWPAEIVEHIRRQSKEFTAYWQMARPINLLPSLMLVLVGAWAGSGRSLAAFSSWPVWLMSLLSGGVAVASVIVNDYFDYASGVDVTNAPSKPLPSGVVPPDGALLLSSVLYMTVLVAACCMEPLLLRIIVAASAMATLLYTPLLKRMTLLKNLTVASIVAASPITGALAAGTGRAGLHAVLPLCAYVFFGIFYREVLMDMNDAEGDRAAAVWTLPVVYGKRTAMHMVLGAFSAAVLVSCRALYNSGTLASLASALNIASTPVRAAGVVCMLGIVLPVYKAARHIMQSNFDVGTVSQAIDASLKPIGAGMLLLACLA